MNALIMGAGGFVGGYLIKELAVNRNWNVFATKLPDETIDVDCKCGIYDLDILNEQDISDLISSISPDFIFHLAAQSSVALSWKNPALTVDINIKGCVNLLEAVRKSKSNPRIILVGSSEEYGYASGKQTPITEDVTPEPGNIYAVTKYTQELIGKVYAKAYDMDIISVRAFNHIGPGQSPQFVVSDFCKQIAEIEKGIKDPIIYVGNLSAQRDFTDVRDIMSAYADIALKGKSNETYNVGSGKAISINSILEIVLSLSSNDIRIEVDKDKFRPVDIPRIAADISKLERDTEWKAKYNITDTIKSMLDYWRSRCSVYSNAR